MVDKLERVQWKRDVCDFYLGDCQNCGKRADRFNQDEPCTRGPLMPITLPTPTQDTRDRVKALEEALEAARDLLMRVKQTNDNVWWIDAEDPELLVCGTYDAIEDALGNKETDRG